MKTKPQKQAFNIKIAFICIDPISDYFSFSEGRIRGIADELDQFATTMKLQYISFATSYKRAASHGPIDALTYAYNSPRDIYVFTVPPFN